MSRQYYLGKQKGNQIKPIKFTGKETLLNSVFPINKWDIIGDPEIDNEGKKIYSIDTNFRIDLIAVTKINRSSTSYNMYKFFENFLPEIEKNLYQLNVERNKITLVDYFRNTKYNYTEKKTKIIIFGHCNIGTDYISSDVDEYGNKTRISIQNIIEIIKHLYKDNIGPDRSFKIFFHNCYSFSGICKMFDDDEIKQIIQKDNIEMIIYCIEKSVLRYQDLKYFNNDTVSGYQDDYNFFGNLVKIKISKSDPEIIEDWKEGIETLKQFYLTEFLNNN